MDLTKLLSKWVDNPRVLQQATGYLENYWDVPDYYRMLADWVLDGSQRTEIRLFAAVVLKNHIRDFWNDKVTKSEKKVVRQKLVQALRVPHNLIRVNTCYALSQIIQFDFPQAWPTCFEELGAFLNATELAAIDSGLQAACIIFEAQGEHLIPAIPRLLSELMNIFSNQFLPVEYQERCLLVVQSCLETISWADGIRTDIVENSLDGSFLIWVKLLIKLLEEPLVDPTKYNIVRLSLRILTTFFRDLANYSKVSLGLIVKLAWKLIYNYIPAYMKEAIFNREICAPSDFEEEEHLGVTGIVGQLVELLSCLIMRPTVAQAINEEIAPIVTGLSIYLFMTKDQEMLINLDNFEDEDDEVEMSSVRSCTLKLIRDLVELTGDNVIEACVDIANKYILNTGKDLLFTNQEEMREYIDSINYELRQLVELNPQLYSWKSREATQYMLGRMAEDIMVFGQKAMLGDFFRSIFESVVLCDLEADSPFLLKCRSLWLVNKFSPVLNENETSIFDTCGKCIGPEYPLAVRLTSCMPISKFSRKVSQGNVEQTVQFIFESLSDLIGKISIDYMRIAIETMVDISHLSIDVTSHAPTFLASKMLNLYRCYHSVSGIGKAVENLLRIWCNIPECVGTLSNIFVPYLKTLLLSYQACSEGKTPGSSNSSSTIDSRSQHFTKNDNYIILPNFLEILILLLKKCNIEQPEGSTLMEWLPIIIDLMMKNDDPQLITHGTGCIRTYVAVAHRQIILQNLSPKIIELCNKILDPTLPETAALHLGYLVVQIFAKLSPKIDQEILVGLIQKLHKCKLPSVVQGIVLVFARLILVNTNEILTFLANLTIENRMALKVLLDKWLIHQPLMRGKYTKNATICALGTFFGLKDQRIESLLVVGFNPSHSSACVEVSASLKMLSILIRCLDNESIPGQKRKIKFEEENPTTVVEMGGLGIGGAFEYEDEDGVCDTVESESEDERENPAFMDEGEEYDPLEAIKDELNVDEDYEYADINIKEREKTTLKDYETGSECYLSDMLDFEYDAEEEMGDEINEEDLFALYDSYEKIELQKYLLDLIQKFLDNDRLYLLNCVRQLTREDQGLFRKHFTL